VAIRRRPLADRPPDAAGLALRLERAEAEQLARAGAPGLAGALEVAGGLAVSKGSRSQASAALGLGLAGPVSRSALDRVEAHLGALGGAVRVELCPQADPSLCRELARRGYRLERFHQVLSRPVVPLSAPARAGPEVRPIRAAEERAFAEVFARAHLGRAPVSREEAEDLLAIGRAEGSCALAAFDGGRVVAVAVVSARDGVAALSGAGVLPRWRGRGIQLALVRARLAWAEAHGCDVAAATAAPGSTSQRNLERAGFRVAYPKSVMVRGG
jgi:GNAT superfamily N-acetyltransferase